MLLAISNRRSLVLLVLRLVFLIIDLFFGAGKGGRGFRGAKGTEPPIFGVVRLIGFGIIEAYAAHWLRSEDVTLLSNHRVICTASDIFDLRSTVYSLGPLGNEHVVLFLISELPVGENVNRKKESTEQMAARRTVLRALSKHISLALVEIVP